MDFSIPIWSTKTKEITIGGWEKFTWFPYWQGGEIRDTPNRKYFGQTKYIWASFLWFDLHIIWWYNEDN